MKKEESNKNKKNNSKARNVILIIILAICVALVAFSVYKLIEISSEYAVGDNEYNNLIEIAMPSSKPNDDSSEALPDDIENIDFSALKSLNPDIVGWISSPGTVINYPIVKGSDNSFYLTHTFDKTQNKNGCLFIDRENEADFSDDNTIIYGHHMKSGKMFASLCEYREQNYYENHPYMYLYTPDSVYKLHVFSAYITDNSKGYSTIRFQTPDDFNAQLKVWKSKSLIETNVEVTGEDKIVSMQTCTYEFADALFLVHAKLEKIA